jgi:hypothetical protein
MRASLLRRQGAARGRIVRAWVVSCIFAFAEEII